MPLLTDSFLSPTSAGLCEYPDLAVLRGERDAAGLVSLRRGRSHLGSARAAGGRHPGVGVPRADQALGGRAHRGREPGPSAGRDHAWILSYSPVQGHPLQVYPFGDISLLINRALPAPSATGRAQTQKYIPTLCTENMTYVPQTRIVGFLSRQQMFWVLKRNLLICFDL